MPLLKRVVVVIVAVSPFLAAASFGCGDWFQLLTPRNTYLRWTDTAGNCNSLGGVCGNTLTLSVATFGADLSCFPHTFLWQFGDGTSVETSSANVTHTYSSAGTYQVVTFVRGADTGQSDGSADLKLTGSIPIAVSVPVLSSRAVVALIAAIALLGACCIRPAN